MQSTMDVSSSSTSKTQSLGIAAEALVFFCRHYPLQKGRSRLIRLVDQVLPKGSYNVTAKMRHTGANLCVPRADWLSLHMFTFGDYEQDIIDLLQAAMRKGKAEMPVLVDIGANLGSITVSTMLGVKGRAIAFEPVPSLTVLFEENKTRNGLKDRITLNSVAVGAADGEISFYFNPEQLAYSGSSPLEGSTEIKVPVHKLSSIISKEDWLATAVMKVDVEGFENDVFNGAAELFALHRPPIVFEMNGEALEGRGMSPKFLVDILRGFGYTTFHAIDTCLYPPENGTYAVSNLLATTAEHADLVKTYGYDASFKAKARNMMPVAPLHI